VTIVEVLEDTTRLQEGEFLITTGFGLASDERKMNQFIPSLVERKLSGVALHTGFYLREIPAAFIETANLYSLPLIEIPSEMNFSTVTKAILQPIVNRQFETLAYSQAIHQRMIEAALSKGGLPAIAGELVRLTGGMVQIVDSFGYDVVRSGPEAGASDNVRLYTSSVPIRANRDTYGILSLTKPKHLWKELDHVAQQHAATLCALEYMKERAIAATEWRLQGDFAEEILSGRMTDPAEAETRGRTLGYALGGSHLIAALRISANIQTEAAMLQQKVIPLVKRLADRKGIAYLVKERPHYLLLIIPDNAASKQLLGLLAMEWGKLYPQHPLQTGLSNARDKLSALADAAQEAIFALQVYPLLAKPPELLLYANLQGYQFLFPFHQKPETLQPLWRPMLEPLIAYDAKYGQQLVETLDVYFSQNLNGLKAAQSLFIHRHTLKYRLQQIEEKTGCSLLDAAQRWQLQLALMAYRLHQLLYPL
jgi:purine catabolism regulator